MRIAVVAALLVTGGLANAQPGAAPPPPPPPPSTTPAPPAYPPAPHQYQPGYAYPVQLTADEHELLMRGEISDAEHILGGAASIFLSFGTGQAIQGRWAEKGWVFTLGQGASTVAMIAGAIRVAAECVNSVNEQVNCDHSDGTPLLIAGVLGFSVFYVWGVIDAFAAPPEHNRKLRELKWRMGMPVKVGWKPYLTKTHDGGATAGLTLRF